MTFTQQNNHQACVTPFDLNDTSAYQQWRDNKLNARPKNIDDLIVHVDNVNNITKIEYQQLLSRCQNYNAALYVSKQPLIDKHALRRLCARFGLSRLDNNLCAESDGISALHVVPKGQRQEYIPYSNHAINWHTDGYYNALEFTIRAMVLHCVSPAANGGENGLIDHELVYIHLRETNPEFVSALMQDDAMTIPPNIQDGKMIRPEQSGPVFSIDPLSGKLHMRYTARTRSIQWKDNSQTTAAVKCLEDLLATNSDFQFKVKLAAGHGLITNNVLHSRTAFVDTAEQQRLVYRARFYERIHNT